MPLLRSLSAPVSFATWERYQSSVAELTGEGWTVVQARRAVVDASLALGAVSAVPSSVPRVSASAGLPLRVERTAVADAAFARYRLASVEDQRAYASWALTEHVRHALRFWLVIGEEDRQAVFRTVGLARALAL